MSLKLNTTAATIPCPSTGCNFKTKRREYLQKHLKNRHQPRPEFRCEFCDKLFATKVGWGNHLNRHTGELLPCTFCDFKTPHAFSLKKHIKKHEFESKGLDWPKPPNTHKCQICGYLAPSEARVVMHARIHFDELPYKCSVPGCDHRTKWKGNLKQHEARHDPIKSTRFQCPMCPKRFCTDYQLVRHVRTHTQERTRECPDCDYKAATLIQVKRHQQRHHVKEAEPPSPEAQKKDNENQRKETVAAAETRTSLRDGIRAVKIGRRSRSSSIENSEIGNDPGRQRNEKRKAKGAKILLRIYPKTHICGTCGLASSCNSHLKDHMRTHSDEKPFHCQVPNCNFQTRWEVSLEGHTERLHTPKKYTCPLEGCDFQSKDLILSRKHRRLHKLPLQKTLQCPLCPKMYASKIGLDWHVLSHTGEKAFKCDFFFFPNVQRSLLTS